MMRQDLSFLRHLRAAFMLSLPLVGGHLAQMTIGLTDAMMIGWYGVEELAALTVASGAYFLFFLVGSGFAWAVMPMVAGFAAKGDETSLRRATRMGLWLSAGFALSIMPLLVFSGPILRVLGQNQNVSELAQLYLSIAGWGLIPGLAVMVLKSYLAALERTQIVFWTTVLGAAANALANYALIFGHWGAPELGIIGAALASIITQLCMLIGVMLYAAKQLPEHQIFKRLWSPDWEMMGRVFKLGVPIGLTSLSEVGLFFFSSILAGWLGTLELAAHGIALNIASVAFMIHMGLSNAATIRVGNAYARSDLSHLKRGALAVICLSAVVAFFAAAVFVFEPEPLIKAFMREDEPAQDVVLGMGVWLLMIAALFQIADGAQVLALGLLRGVQDTATPMIIAAFSYWGVGAVASYVLAFPLDWGLDGIWYGFVLGLSFAGGLLMLRFWRVSVPKLSAP